VRKIFIAVAATLLFAVAVQAQSELIPDNLPLIYSQSLQTIPLSVEPAQEQPGQVLPDAPIPVLPGIQDGPFPCPAGVGKPCALLGGRLYFRDPSHMTEHDLTWGKAMRNPMMVVGGLLNLASLIADAEGTQACLHAHTCTEGNPIWGAHPSRAKMYGFGIPLEFCLYSISASMKKRGRGNTAFVMLWSDTILHVYLAAHGFSIASKGSPAKPNSSIGQSFGLVIKF
jgi:hypothetical protein